MWTEEHVTKQLDSLRTLINQGWIRCRTSQYCFIVLTLLFYPGMFAQKDPYAWDMMQAEGKKITHTENKPAEF